MLRQGEYFIQGSNCIRRRKPSERRTVNRELRTERERGTGQILGDTLQVLKLYMRL
jgi:hypothetical protein